MLALIRSRRAIAKTLLLLLLAVQAAGVIARISASASSLRPTQASMPAEKALSVADATRALDRFLDHHPLLEEKLRMSPRLVRDEAFLAQNPDLRDFARSNPPAIARLSTERRHLLYRALLRQANVLLPMRELATFGELFDREPALERELNENPEFIREPEFLNRHPALHEFLLQRPRLGVVFSAPPPAKKTN
jgi:hypothetical protein